MNLEKLKTGIPASVFEQIPEVMAKFQINTPLRLAHFLSQCAHESINFTAVRENLNYQHADSVMRVFKKYFPTVQLAQQYTKNPAKLGSRVYASRMGNGPEESGEGFKYRGRGYIQLTGKVNYAAFDKVVDENVVADPDIVATKYPMLSAAWFWNTRNLNKLADAGATTADVEKITRVINGGTNGLPDRIAKFNKFYALLA